MNVLILEDDVLLASCLSDVCKVESHTPFVAHTLKDALLLFKNNPVDIIISDIYISEKPEGIQFIKEVRASNLTIPIISISSQIKDTHNIQLYEIGVDDFIEKPVQLNKLILKLNRWCIHLSLHSFSLGEFTVKPIDKQIFYKQKELSLTKYQYKILLILLKEPSKYHSRDDLINKIKGSGFKLGSRSLDVHILNIKKILKSKTIIKNKRNFGYMIEER